MRRWSGRSRKSSPGDRRVGGGADLVSQNMWRVCGWLTCRRATYARAATQAPAVDFGCAFGRDVVGCRVRAISSKLNDARRIATGCRHGTRDGSSRKAVTCRNANQAYQEQSACGHCVIDSRRPITDSSPFSNGAFVFFKQVDRRRKLVPSAGAGCPSFTREGILRMRSPRQ
jgi:hypothetical protein